MVWKKLFRDGDRMKGGLGDTDLMPVVVSIGKRAPFLTRQFLQPADGGATSAAGIDARVTLGLERGSVHVGLCFFPGVRQTGNLPKALATAKQMVRHLWIQTNRPANQTHHGQGSDREKAFTHEIDDLPVFGGELVDAALKG